MHLLNRLGGLPSPIGRPRCSVVTDREWGGGPFAFAPAYCTEILNRVDGREAAQLRSAGS